MVLVVTLYKVVTLLELFLSLLYSIVLFVLNAVNSKYNKV